MGLRIRLLLMLVPGLIFGIWLPWLGVVVVSVTLILSVHHLLLAPLARLKTQLDNVLAGRQQVISPPTGKDELSQLQSSISRLQESMQLSHESAEYLANHDALTGLANQRRFRNQLNNSLMLSQQTGSTLTLVFIDLDEFKGINDRLGHQAGDHALKGLAGRMQMAIEKAGLEHKVPIGGMARLSGDEFAITLEDATIHDGERLAQTLGELMQQPLMLLEQEVKLSCSIGVVTSRRGSTYQQLLRQVDFAMYRVKKSGKGNYCLFDAMLAQRMRRNDQLVKALEKALKRGSELQLYMQPFVNAKGQVVGAETLLRWKSRELGWVGPGEFIPVIEKSQLIHRLDRWVLGQAIAWLGKHKDLLGLDFRLAVNISSRELRDQEFPQVLDSLLEQYQVPACMLELEITETSLTELDGLFASTAHALKSIGVSLSLDDFGTGYLSLNHLARLPVDKLKIDRSHVAEINDEHKPVKLAEAVLMLAQSYHLKITGEGVEQEVQAKWLRGRGCDFLQGYHFFKPMPAKEFETLLLERSRAA